VNFNCEMIFGFKCTPVDHLQTLSIKNYATDEFTMKIFKEVDAGKESRFLAVAKKLLAECFKMFR